MLAAYCLSSCYMQFQILDIKLGTFYLKVRLDLQSLFGLRISFNLAHDESTQRYSLGNSLDDGKGLACMKSVIETYHRNSPSRLNSFSFSYLLLYRGNRCHPNCECLLGYNRRRWPFNSFIKRLVLYWLRIATDRQFRLFASFWNVEYLDCWTTTSGTVWLCNHQIDRGIALSPPLLFLVEIGVCSHQTNKEIWVSVCDGYLQKAIISDIVQQKEKSKLLQVTKLTEITSTRPTTCTAARQLKTFLKWSGDSIYLARCFDAL